MVSLGSLATSACEIVAEFFSKHLSLGDGFSLKNGFFRGLSDFWQKHRINLLGRWVSSPACRAQQGRIALTASARPPLYGERYSENGPSGDMSKKNMCETNAIIIYIYIYPNI